MRNITGDREAFAKLNALRRETLKDRSVTAAKLREGGAAIAAEYARRSQAGVRVHGPAHALDERQIAHDKIAIDFLQRSLNQDSETVEACLSAISALLTHCVDLETKLAEASTAGQPG